MYLEIKDKIRKEIISQHGKMVHFIERNPELNINQQQLSMYLNPSKNCTLETLLKILSALNLDLDIKRRKKVKAELE